MKIHGSAVLFGQLNAAAFGAMFALKLAHVITWSWWIVFLPFEWPIAAVLLAAGIVIVYKASR